MNTTKISNILHFFIKDSITPNPITETHNYYWTLSKKCLKMINDKYFRTIDLIDNDDVLTDLTTALMLADMYYDPSKSSQKYWRTKCVLWQLNNFVRNKEDHLPLTVEPIYNITPEDELHQYELNYEISESLNSLDERDANIMIDYYYNDLSQTEIAQKNDITQPRVFQILEKNKKYLQEDLLEFYGNF